MEVVCGGDCVFDLVFGRLDYWLGIVSVIVDFNIDAHVNTVSVVEVFQFIMSQADFRRFMQRQHLFLDFIKLRPLYIIS